MSTETTKSSYFTFLITTLQYVLSVRPVTSFAHGLFDQNLQVHDINDSLRSSSPGSSSLYRNKYEGQAFSNWFRNGNSSHHVSGFVFIISPRIYHAIDSTCKSNAVQFVKNSGKVASKMRAFAFLIASCESCSATGS
jgi:hypothetical protein